MTENGRQKGTLSETVRKELRVVISGNRSPLPLRIVKWALFLSIARMLYGTRWFRTWVFGLPVAGLVTHLLYRHMTRMDETMGRVEGRGSRPTLEGDLKRR